MFRPVKVLSVIGGWRAAFVAALVVGLLSRAAPAAEPEPRDLRPTSFQWIAPAIAWEGETFSGMVVAETEQGSVPLAEGDQVVFNGQVVQTVKPDGSVEIPGKALAPSRCAHCDAGVLPYQVTVRSIHGKPVDAARSTLVGEIRLIPRPENRQDHRTPSPLNEPRVSRLSAIITGQTPVSVFGQGLDRLKDAALVGENGWALPLSLSVGSSLQRIYVPQRGARLPNGAIRFVAWDDAGRRLEAPQAAKNPRLQLEGTRITRAGEPGEIIVLSDTSGLVQLTGGQPHISVYQQPFPVQANVPKTARFMSQLVGPYTVAGRIWNPEDLPPAADAKRAIVTQPPVRYEYDAASRLIRVDVPVQVHDEQGMPMKDVPVELVVVHPQGVDYAVARTDPLGHALATLRLPGEAAPQSVAAHVFRLPAMRWLPQEEPKCKGCSVAIVNVWADYTANAVDPKVAKVLGKSLDNLAVQWKHDGKCDCNPGKIHIHAYMATAGGGKVNSNGDAGKEDEFEDPNSSCTPGATGFWTKNFISGAVGLYYKGSIRVYAECHDCGAKSQVWSDDKFEKYDKLKDNEDYKAFLKKLEKKP
jgi:hypothetical protein